MPTQAQDKGFAEEMRDSVDEIRMANGTLDNAIAWISKNLDPGEVFSDKDLAGWAESNGYFKE